MSRHHFRRPVVGAGAGAGAGAGVTRPDEDVVGLSRDGSSRLMTWSASLNIYRVNRFHPIDLDEGRRRRHRWRGEDGVDADPRLDLVEQLLLRNMLDAVENIFEHVGLETAQDCLLVCRLWYDFLSTHLFKRWAERTVDADEALKELAAAEGWIKFLHLPTDQVEDFLVYRKICFRIFDLKEVWRYREPKLRRLSCESFVLSLRFSGDALYCGLNNGCLQLWDLDWCSKRREQEVHDKGVKCLDVGERLMATGSYDCTAKIWRRDDWQNLHVISLHQDSVWDLRLRGDRTLVTGGLDGAIGMFQISEEEVRDGEEEEEDARGGAVSVRRKRGTMVSRLDTRFIMQAHQDLVSAVDFSEDLLVAGYEDSRIGVWGFPEGDGDEDGDVDGADGAVGAVDAAARVIAAAVSPSSLPALLHRLSGHSGGITGLRLNAAGMVASSSYDATVRLWNARTAQCLLEFREPEHFVRCISLAGSVIAAGDFGGHVHIWDVQVSYEGDRAAVRNRRHFKAHGGHVVSIQVSARRVLSGSRDKTALVQDFWAKMLDVGSCRRNRREAAARAAAAEEEKGSRFLARRRRRAL